MTDIDAASAIAREIVKARQAQIQKHGFGPEHDDRYRSGELPMAAATYVMVAARPQMRTHYRNTLWPWPDHWLRHESPRDSLIKAAAILVAEIERIDRAAARLPAAPARHDLTEHEWQALEMLAGEREGIGGAWLHECCEHLKSIGYAAGLYHITEAGKAALARRKAENPT